MKGWLQVLGNLWGTLNLEVGSSVGGHCRESDRTFSPPVRLRCVGQWGGPVSNWQEWGRERAGPRTDVAHCRRRTLVAGAPRSASAKPAGLAEGRPWLVRSTGGRTEAIMGGISPANSRRRSCPQNFLQKQQRRALGECDCGRIDSRGYAFGLPSRADRQPHA